MTAVARRAASPTTTAPEVPPRRSTPGRLLRRGLPPVAVVVAVFAAWEAVTSAFGIDPRVLPGPVLIVSSTWDDRAALWPAITTTTEETVLGLLVALAVAFALGVSIDWSRSLRRSLYPLVVASQTLPIVALAPLVIVWFGFGLAPKVLLVALFSFFPIVVGLVQGLGGADPEALDLLRTMRASRWQLLTRVKLPGALPQLFTGLKISVTYAFTSAIVAEFVGATQGLGFFMTQASTNAPVRTDLVFGATLVTAVLTVALFLVVALVERFAMPWRPPRRA
ncbi:MAG TPA: ABC transporter permease [Acidimicrobiales bacterium]|nr:ABC transporter permease [Acidimicrobiales bacterium]